jgi:hypothetical protein
MSDDYYDPREAGERIDMAIDELRDEVEARDEKLAAKDAEIAELKRLVVWAARYLTTHRPEPFRTLWEKIPNSPEKSAVEKIVEELQPKKS